MRIIIAKITVTGVVLAGAGDTGARRRMLWAKVRKALKIGLLGALNGMRIRPWFNGPPTASIDDICRSLNIPLHRVEQIKSKQTVEIFRTSGADLGLSLGNGYITRKVFSVPPLGMINVHTERLPDYQNAQGVIWPIFNMERTTGVTIHQIDTGIDKGPIVLRADFPILFRRTLQDTVTTTVDVISRAVPGLVLKACEDFDLLHAAASPQPAGRRYTTPSFRAFLRMVHNNRKLFMDSANDASKPR